MRGADGDFYCSLYSVNNGFPYLFIVLQGADGDFYYILDSGHADVFIRKGGKASAPQSSHRPASGGKSGGKGPARHRRQDERA